MKNVSTIAALTGAALLSACASTHNTQTGGRIVSPSITDLPSHLALGKKTKGTSEINTFQIVGLKFHSDATTGKRISTNPSSLAVPAYHSEMGAASGAGDGLIPGASIILNKVTSPTEKLLGLMEDPVFFLFGSPASRTAALSSARWEAVETSGGDGIIETRAKADITGWSILGLIGFGSAKGYVDGQSFKIAEGWKAKPGTMPEYFKSDGKTKTNLFQLTH
jgi:hypothetical protein